MLFEVFAAVMGLVAVLAAVLVMCAVVAGGRDD